MTRTAEDVMREARQGIRDAICDAFEKIKVETGLQPTDMDIWVDVISTGPQFGGEEYLVGDVRIEFKV